jgi:hypothetical protein
MVGAFVARWQQSAASERANYGLFLIELCEVLELPRPEPATGEPERDGYVFERAVAFHNSDGTTSTGFIDLYRHDCFVLETKQGCEAKQEATLLEKAGLRTSRRRRGHGVRGTETWDAAMLRARGQAEQYAKALPEWPSFLIVVDVGHSIETYADFTGTGKHYAQYPDTSGFRIFLPDLARQDVRDRLRAIWLDPLSLDPTRHAARVTREIAARLALLGRSLEKDGHGAERVALFLMRALFTMFADNVGLLRKESFRELLRGLRDRPQTFAPMMHSLWASMDKGGFSPELGDDILRFNGGLFDNTEAIALNADQLEMLIDAAERDWSAVEPAIFGTLLERALDERERERLGAHYTPRAYVERLVLPTIIEPLRSDWEAVKAAAVELADAGDKAGAVAELRRFHEYLCNVTILDPACGTGNFLYVALEHLKRLEGEVLDLLAGLGESLTFEGLAGHTVDPHQLRGIEANPRAVAITELVLWIGYLQWHFRIRGNAMPAEPVLRNFRNIEHRDALLTWRSEELVRGPDNRPLTRWDGRTKKPHPITGEMVPDENARVEVVRLLGAQPARWPRADFIIGNPPFIGAKYLRDLLGDGYVEALWSVYRQMPQSADYVMYWWNRGAQTVSTGRARGFGFITTNSLSQAFNRRVVQQHLEHVDGVSLAFAIADHPWVNASDAAAVRIAMMVGVGGRDQPGRLLEVTRETPMEDGESDAELLERVGVIHAGLRIGADITRARPLQANEGLCSPGVKLHGAGFIVTPDQAKALGLGRVSSLDQHIRPYLNGRDLTGRSRNVMVIDLFGLTEAEVRHRFPEVYQWVLERVWPEREQNNRASYRNLWWVFGEPRSEIRPALIGLDRFCATIVTAKHRLFLLIDGSILPDDAVITVALSDAHYLGVLSSRIHVAWARSAGGTLEDRERYNKSRCLDPFPFPDCGECERAAIAAIAEELDALRKERLRLNPDLTLTALYNVLAKLRSGEPLTEAERDVHDRGLVGVLRRLHDDLDRAVFAAYGWPADIGDDELLTRLVALNRERAEEEFRGTIRWLRPEFQSGIAAAPVQRELEVAPAAAAARQSWPRDLPEQFRAVRAALTAQGTPAAVEEVAGRFARARRERVAEVLEPLVSLGQARRPGPGLYAV